MKGLAVIGTTAMFLVGGGILVHGLPGAHHPIEAAVHASAALPGVGGVLGAIVPLLVDGFVGVAAGGLVLTAITLGKRLGRR